MKVLGILIGLFISVPIWFYLLFQILVAVDANELMWFLYWIYLPATIFGSIAAKLTEESK